MKVLIIEDETAASENLIAMLHQQDASIEILDVLESVQQVVRWLGTHPEPDLMFMDIHLSDGSAFMLFDQLEVHTPIIFTTAYDQYALEAFRVNSLDYLLKPIRTADLKRALDKFRHWGNNDLQQYLERIMTLKTDVSRKTYKESILVPERDKLIPVSLNDVACIYSSERNTSIYLKNGRSLAYNKSLDSIIDTLDPVKFTRANKQYIVSREAIENLTIWFDNRLLVNTFINLPEPMVVSKNKASEFKNWLTDGQ